jgi:NADH dehydrogenase/NADH:ubiquinone oxidoreductase subunit G
MPKITIYIDGHEITAHPGDNILGVALKHGIYIPHLCYDVDLMPFGGCRLCIVEVKGLKGFPAACTTEVSDGMEVSTWSPQLARVRRDTLELLLSEHPLDCLTCSANQRCGLQEAAARLGVMDRSLRRTGNQAQIEQLTPFLDIDRNYCILCQKCVRACGEIANKNILAVAERGAKSRVVSFAGEKDKIASCPECLECVKRCPTAALKEKRWSPQQGFDW